MSRRGTLAKCRLAMKHPVKFMRRMAHGPASLAPWSEAPPIELPAVAGCDESVEDDTLVCPDAAAAEARAAAGVAQI